MITNPFVGKQIAALQQAERRLIHLRAEACVAALHFIEGDLVIADQLERLDAELERAECQRAQVHDALLRLGLSDADLPQLPADEKTRLFTEHLHGSGLSARTIAELLNDADLHALLDELSAVHAPLRPPASR